MPEVPTNEKMPEKMPEKMSEKMSEEDSTTGLDLTPAVEEAFADIMALRKSDWSSKELGKVTIEDVHRKRRREIDTEFNMLFVHFDPQSGKVSKPFYLIVKEIVKATDLPELKRGKVVIATIFRGVGAQSLPREAAIGGVLRVREIQGSRYAALRFTNFQPTAFSNSLDEPIQITIEF